MPELPLITNVTTQEVWRIMVEADVSGAPQLEPRHGSPRRVSFDPSRIATIYEPNGHVGWRIWRTIVDGPRCTQGGQRTGSKRRAQEHFDSTQIGDTDEWIREFAIMHRPLMGGGTRRAATS